ncbi:MAG: N-acetyltransferase [Pseudomonadota bacterium]
MFRLLPEKPRDLYEVEMLFDLAFAPGRQALSSYQLRDGVAPFADLCLIARDEYDSVSGAIRYWPIAIQGEAADDRPAPTWPALLLGPIAVHTTRQGEGLGALLIAETLDRARAAGWSRVLLVGDAPYYARFGFRRALAAALDFPRPVNPERVLATELSPNAMRDVAGTVVKWPDDIAAEPR